MFLRKVDGCRSVRLPDGSVLTQADLPPIDCARWVASRKAAVVKGVAYGLISRETALCRYGLSAEEFRDWVSAYHDHGAEALKVTRARKYRRSQVDPCKVKPW